MGSEIVVQSSHDKNMEYVGRLANILPNFKSFKRMLTKVGAKIQCSGANEKYLSLFNNRENFFYNIHAVDRQLTNNEFSEGLKILKKSITYFTQTWSEWINIGRYVTHANGYVKTGDSRMTGFNAIIYCVFMNDEDEVIPFAYICEMNDVTSYDEADEHIEKGILDQVVDLFSTSVGEDCQVMAIIPIPSVYRMKEIGITKKLLNK